VAARDRLAPTPAQGVGDISSRDILQLMLLTQYVDTLKVGGLGRQGAGGPRCTASVPRLLCIFPAGHRHALALLDRLPQPLARWRDGPVQPGPQQGGRGAYGGRRCLS
jgi:hypothetical protein